MNIYKSLNQIISYIEEHLDQPIPYTELAKMLGVNVYTLQRIFSLITNISLSEYIRKRRLSNAGFDLYNTGEKVIDVAMKYQYNNATSFSRAFQAFHGVKPSEVKRGVHHFKNFPRITLDEKIKMNQDISYEIIELDELVLYGKGIKTDEKHVNQDAPNFWKYIFDTYNFLYDSAMYGMTSYENRFESDLLEYWILWDYKIDGFQEMVIPKSKWLVFHTTSTEACDIQKICNDFYDEFLPSCKFNLRDIPELEYYHDGVTDFMVPIE